MKILIVNPNTTVSMTEKIAAAATTVALADTEIITTNSNSGPASIEGYFDVAICIPGLLAECMKYPDVDAVVIACFDDTGIDALRCLLDVPVVGIGEAAYHAASMLATRFTVITTLPRSVPGLEANLHRYGLAARCGKVRATDISVLSLEEGSHETLHKIKQTLQIAIEQDLAEAIVLGCAGMADMMERLSQEFQIPVIDGVTSAVVFAQALVRAGLKTSKIGAYAQPNIHSIDFVTANKR